nr:hypothetical protein [Bradyrhizobium paxllaeri]
MRYEVSDDFVEWNRAAVGNEAIAFSLRTTAERTEPAKIPVAHRFEQKDIQLVADNADAETRFICLAQGSTGRPADFPEAVLPIDPERQIEIAAFMPDFDALATKLPEPRNLLPQRLGDRAYHGDRLDLWKRHPRLRDDICRHAKLTLALQKIAVLFLDFGAPHFLTPEAS